jgi:ornithine cyclodeaminase/alanine dehydrogenase-like protein (mu-crystallin family)
MPSMSAGPPPLRYLAADDVIACMPALPERLALAERTMRALVADADMPPKIGIHASAPGTFAHAMPAYLRAGRDGGPDAMGIKWVSGASDNNARGLPSINAIVVLNDPLTALPIAILDGGSITAQRTAAVSGVAIRRFAPWADRPLRAAVVGAGTQAGTHLPVLGHVAPGVEVAAYDRHPERAESLIARAGETEGIGRAVVADSARAAIDGADIVLTLATFTTPDRRQMMTLDWLAPDALVVAVDYDTMCAAEVAVDAALFLVDDRGQFQANRDAGSFAGYPDPDATIGEALIAKTPRPTGRVLVSHLGVGLADVVFAAAILEAAVASGRGMLLPR